MYRHQLVADTHSLFHTDDDDDANMSTNIELEDLKGKRKAEAGDNSSVENTDAYDNSVGTWAYGCAALYVPDTVYLSPGHHLMYLSPSLTSLAIPLLFFPRFIHFLSDSDPNNIHSDRTLSPLERLLSTHFGILLIAFASTLVLYVRREMHVSSLV